MDVLRESYFGSWSDGYLRGLACVNVVAVWIVLRCTTTDCRLHAFAACFYTLDVDVLLRMSCDKFFHCVESTMSYRKVMNAIQNNVTKISITIGLGSHILTSIAKQNRLRTSHLCDDAHFVNHSRVHAFCLFSGSFR